MSEIWDFLQSPPGGAAFNMALDEALLRYAPGRGRPLLRVYSWEKPAVSFGYFQKFPEHLAGKYEIVRRPTGGGLVYHGDGVDMTYTVVVPSGHGLFAMKTAEAYRELHEALATAFATKPALHDAPLQSPHGQYECFQKPVAGDLIADGRKLAGGAQRRSKAGMLHQGSIAGTISSAQLKRGFEETFSITYKDYKLSDTERALAEKSVCEKYATDAWNRHSR